MWEIIVGLPLLAGNALIQINVFSKVRLLNGAPDLFLLFFTAWEINEQSKYGWIITIAAGLMMSYFSAMPMHGYLWMYLLILAIIRFIKRRVWQMPIILTLFMTFIGTFIEGIGTLALLYLQRAAINLMDALRMILIPSLVLNILLAIPVYAFVTDILNTIYPYEVAE